ncbi:hypothetical protein R0137_04970 [Congregibacter brevis]|uniref:Uncharacterized protein n=1 Tax=Congregibacter brevis TaxID=3081201 RepID=A0ABZ0IFI6_9GAMM|nr:hypothetical protein R0137_04970 [Congregibacter sp. IMCC45268]
MSKTYAKLAQSTHWDATSEERAPPKSRIVSEKEHKNQERGLKNVKNDINGAAMFFFKACYAKEKYFFKKDPIVAKKPPKHGKKTGNAQI